jgi:hypothetical protein
LSGLAAKSVTRAYHLYSLPGNRTRTAADWAINTVMPPRAVQLGLVGAKHVRLECTAQAATGAADPDGGEQLVRSSLETVEVKRKENAKCELQS